jgi:hypothetical protein
MSVMTGRIASVLAPGSLLIGCLLALGALAGGTVHSQARTRIAVTPAAAALVDQKLAAAAPTGAEAAAFEEIPAPALRFRVDDARATRAPWVDSNGWRFQRGMKKANYAKLPAGAAALAAAEAFVFDADAILNPDAKDAEPLGKMLAFLGPLEQPRLPQLANIEVVDDRSPAMGEVLNLLTRRNLLYRAVAAPTNQLDLTVKLGTPDFPAEAAANPYEFAAKVRAKLGDDKRLVRLYGSSTAVARLEGDGKRARLYLLDYGGPRDRGMGAGDVQSLRVRVAGRYRPAKVSLYDAKPEAQLTDVENPGNSTEFWVPAFTTLAVIDLAPLK